MPMLPVQSPPPAVHVANLTVKDTRGLNAALMSAKPGTTIQLAPGRYDGAKIDHIKGEGVVVTSADPRSPAVLSRFYITNTTGLTMSNLVLTAEGAEDPYPFRVAASSGVTLTNLSVHGSMDHNPQNDKSGVYIGDSDHVTVKNSEFQELMNGVVNIGSDYTVIDGNYIHDIGTDGIDNGGSSHVTISNNHFTDFHPCCGQHADAIQFWTTNAKESATHLVITNNLIERGPGDAVQGIFLGNETGLVHKDVTISNNTVIGGLYNGITVSQADGVTITGNKVLQVGDQASWIGIRDVDNATVTGNQASKFNYLDSKPKQSGNKVVDNPRDKGASAIAAWQTGHPTMK